MWEILISSHSDVCAPLCVLGWEWDGEQRSDLEFQDHSEHQVAAAVATINSWSLSQL